jgi:hypothetical protein
MCMYVTNSGPLDQWSCISPRNLPTTSPTASAMSTARPPPNAPHTTNTNTNLPPPLHSIFVQSARRPTDIQIHQPIRTCGFLQDRDKGLGSLLGQQGSSEVPQSNLGRMALAIPGSDRSRSWGMTLPSAKRSLRELSMGCHRHDLSISCSCDALWSPTLDSGFPGEGTVSWYRCLYTPALEAEHGKGEASELTRVRRVMCTPK